ncbi:hypothetical protein EBZ02_00615, partial [bacterium]|nr:hypothetical protein [bacterium]
MRACVKMTKRFTFGYNASICSDKDDDVMGSSVTDDDASSSCTSSSSSASSAQPIQAIRKRAVRLRTPAGVLDASHRAVMAQWGGRFLKASEQWTYDEAFRAEVEAYVRAVECASEQSDEEAASMPAPPPPTPTFVEQADACTMTERYLFDVPA